MGIGRKLDGAAIQFTWVRIRPLLWSNNGGVQRQQRSALGARRVPHHLSRMLVRICWDAGRSKKQNITPCSQASPPRNPARGSHGAAITSSLGTRLEGLQGAAAWFSKLFCSPFPRLPQQWSPAQKSSSRGASARPRLTAAHPSPRARPPSVTPAPRHCGPTPAPRPHTRCLGGACPGPPGHPAAGAALTSSPDSLGRPRLEAHRK